MRTRFLPIFFVVAFALTLFFAVAAGAQEERTDTEGVGVQVVVAAETNRVKVTCLMHTTAHIDFLRASGHEHHFAGGGKGTLTQDMTAEELRDSETSCATPSDTALAWFPVINDPGDSVGGYEKVDRVNFYYHLESLHLMPAFGEIDLATHEGGDLSYGCGRNPVKLDAPPVGCTEGDWRVDADLPGTNVSVVIHYKNSDGVLGANPRVSTDAGFTNYRSMHVDYFATFTPEFVELVEACAQQMPNLADECRTEQQQDSPAAAPAPYGGPLAHKAVKVTKGKGNDTVDKNDVLKITGDYEVKDGASIIIEDADGTQATFTDDVNAKITEENGDIRIEVTKEPVTVPSDDSDTKKAHTLNIDNLTAVTSTDVQRAGANNDGGGGDGDGGGGGRDGGGDGGGGGGNPTNPVTPAQDTTTPTTTNDTTITDSDPILEDTTADDAINAGESVRDEGSFRCDFFLRTVRDENGALRAQYRDGNGNDELIVQRFEQCLSEDVLADTIPNRNLPFTGGMPLLFLGAIGLASLFAGASVLGAATRRRR